MSSLENPAGRPATPLAFPEARSFGHKLRTLGGGHNLFMLACCALMVIGTGIVIAAAPSGQSIGQSLLLAAPMLGCVGMHLIMHRLTGKSCHGRTKQESDK